MDVPMSTIAMFLKIERERVAEGLREAQSQLNGSGEAVLDFASVSRLCPKDLASLEALAMLAGEHGVKIELRGVNVGIYKVLKLARLASRFNFRA